MTEEEKIFAGKMFDPRKQELKDLKHKAHEACRKFNMMDEYDPQRQQLLRDILGGVGKTCYFQGPVQINYGSHLFIGENFFANFNLTVMDDARVYIGDNVAIGPNVSIGDQPSADCRGTHGHGRGRQDHDGGICRGYPHRE